MGLRVVLRTAKPPHFLQGSRGVAAATDSNSNTAAAACETRVVQKFQKFGGKVNGKSKINSLLLENVKLIRHLPPSINLTFFN